MSKPRVSLGSRQPTMGWSPDDVPAGDVPAMNAPADDALAAEALDASAADDRSAFVEAGGRDAVDR